MNRGWLRFLRLAVLGLLIALSLQAGMAVAVQETGSQSSQVNSQVNSQMSIMQQGEDAYQAGQLSAAIALWQQAAARYEATGDRLNQSLALSFLASAFGDLGQWPAANEAIAQARSQLSAPLPSQTPASGSSDAAAILAQVLTTQGTLQLSQGQASEAFETWQAAESTYRKLGDTTGILGSQINQARALQAGGFYRRATVQLTQIEQSLQSQPDSQIKVTGLRNLGKVLRSVGDLARSRTILEQSLALEQNLAIAQKQQDETSESASDISGILLSLGNTTRAQGDTDAALTFYQQALAAVPSPTAKAQIQLVQLSLLVEANRSAEAQRLLPTLQAQVASLPPGRLATYAQIDLAQSAIKMSRAAAGAEPSLPLLQDLAQSLGATVQQVHSLGDQRAESYALGTLGNLYETSRQWNDAKTLTQQALSLAQSIDAADIAYQWQWQLGRVECQDAQICSSAANLQQAIAAYAAAVSTLQSLRSDLVAIGQDVQFSFRESVEPVYRQFVELLLQSDTDAPSQENLKQAREAIEALQLAELDNFFRAACVTARPVEIDQIDSQAAVIYPIVLPHQLAVILALPHQPLHYHKTALSQAEVEGILTQMRQSLRPTAFIEDWLPAAQQVYNLLLRPVEAQLSASGIKTLVFVPDGLFRNLPMAALHDGQHYLIENYSAALTPSLQLLPSQSLERLRLRALLAGLSQAREGFAALPNVAVEIDQIKAEVPAQVLLDDSFTNQSFEKQVDSTAASVVHLATHGQFSSNAEDTFILTWDGRINVQQLDQVLRDREDLSPIDLLVLSACETAAGDRRAALGMAGVAVRSGARSTLASLWAVGDRSTASLMVEFYRELGQPEVTKAEALRRAQIALLHQDDYASPYYWAPFVLLGNWL